MTGATTTEQAERAYEYLRQRGWTDDAMVAAASTTGLDLWRTIAVGYASSYLRRGAMDMPRGIRYTALDKDGRPSVSDIATRAAWWADSSGIPPDNGIALSGGASASVDPHVETLEYLRKLWTGDDPEARVLQAWVAETAVRVPRRGLPLGVVHGVSDGLVPLAFSSEPYVAWLREQERQPVFWKVPHAQHFDAFLSLPRFGERYVPLLPYGYAALDRLWSHLYEGETWPSEVDSPETRPRGTGRLQREALGLP